MDIKYRNKIIGKILEYKKRNHCMPNTLCITMEDAKRAQDGGIYFQFVYLKPLPRRWREGTQFEYGSLQWFFKEKGKFQVKIQHYPVATNKELMKYNSQFKKYTKELNER